MVWADIILYVHFLIFLMVILPVPMIVIGRIYHWKFVHKSWFRIGHVILIGLVLLFHFTMGICPLTTWEYQIRYEQLSRNSQDYLIKQIVVSILYPDFEPWVFTMLYVSFGLIVLTLFYFVPIKKS